MRPASSRTAAVADGGRHNRRQACATTIEVRDDLQAAAAHAGITTHELRRSLGDPHVRRYAQAERQTAIERFVPGSPAALARVRDTSENGMAVVAAVKAGELLQQGALATEASAQRRQPGLQIVIVGPGGEKQVAFQPPQPAPLLDAASAPEAEAVPPIDIRDPDH